MPKFRKINGQWREVKDRFVKVNGQWKKVKTSFRKSNGEWLQTYSSDIFEKILVGLENFDGTYIIERREDGAFYVAIDGEVAEGKATQIGFIIPNIPDGSSVAFGFDLVTKDYQRLAVYDANTIRVYCDYTYSSSNDSYSNFNGSVKFVFDLTAAGPMKAHFYIKNLRINGVAV